jgi:hypothetical protein
MDTCRAKFWLAATQARARGQHPHQPRDFRRQQFVAVKNRIGAGKKAERLTFLATPMLEINRAALRNKVGERLMIERRQFRERHNSRWELCTLKDDFERFLDFARNDNPRLMIERVEFSKLHRNARCSIGNRKSAIAN